MNETHKQTRNAIWRCFQRLVRWLLNTRTERLWHPDSPGMRVTVTRTRFGRWFKSADFATLGETIESCLKPKNESNGGELPELATAICSMCESEDCPAQNEKDRHCPSCEKLVGDDGYCGHCVALGDGNPYQSNAEVRRDRSELPCCDWFATARHP